MVRFFRRFAVGFSIVWLGVTVGLALYGASGAVLTDWAWIEVMAAPIVAAFLLLILVKLIVKVAELFR
ncbi:MAG: hypothetical protein MRY74_13025 [Neomegalonema sp.]|nr:hypothetical protein [Neomegalonema sp.]